MEILEKRITTFTKVIQTLEKTITKLQNKKYDDYQEIRDSLIQRFEYCADIYWKLLKDYLKFELSIEIKLARPKSIIKESFESNILTSIEYQTSLKLIEDRNQSSHTYNEDLAEEITKNIYSYFKVMKNVLNKLKNNNIS